MTAREAKVAVGLKLVAAGVPFNKLTARTFNFSDLARCKVVFVTVHGAQCRTNGVALKQKLLEGVPKPSEGGYCVEFEDCQWNLR